MNRTPNVFTGTMPHLVYVLIYNTGFAPKPFFGFCTLACGKPQIRRSARWLSPKQHGVYVAASWGKPRVFSQS